MIPHVVGIVGNVVVEPGVAVRQRAFGMREDRGAVDVGQGVQLRVAVGCQEVIPRPGREVHDLPVQELGADQSAGGDGRCAGPVAFVVGHHREIDLHHLGAGSFEVPAGGLPQFKHGVPGVDPLPGGTADAGGVRGAGLRIGIDVHLRHTEPFPGQDPARGIR